MGRADRIYSIEQVLAKNGREVVIEYLDLGPRLVTSRPLRAGIVYSGEFERDLLAVVSEGGHTAFTVKQVVRRSPLFLDLTPHEAHQDRELHHDVARRLLSNDWEVNANYFLSPLE